MTAWLRPLTLTLVTPLIFIVTTSPTHAATSSVPGVESSATPNDTVTENNTIDVPPGGANLVPNGAFETGANGNPDYWHKGGYGNNTRVFTWPVAGVNGTNAAEVDITNYTDGDADWYFNPLSLPAGVYHYADKYTSNLTSYVDIQIHHSDGSYTYDTLETLPPSTTFANSSADFTVPADAQDITVYHLIEGVGSLVLDNVSVKLKYETQGIFQTGGVTLRFDDGWDSQYTVAYPALEADGLTGTFYIVTHQLLDYGFSGFMSIANVQDLAAHGEEVAAHTQTHPHLKRLSYDQQVQEIQGSYQDLLNMGISPITSFAYPYGQFNKQIIGIVKQTGFTNAGATIDNDATPTTDPYKINGYSVVLEDTPSKIESMIQNALATHTWLVITFHRIDTSGDEYSITPANFQTIIDYIHNNAVPVYTMTGAAQYLVNYGK